jgi:hypothetical protein
MEFSAPDFDRLFAKRGGFAMVVAKLTAYAIIVIKRRSGPTRNGRLIAKLDAKDLVVHALSRLTELPSLEDGEAVYFQLRRHIDNRVRTIQKQKTEPTLLPLATEVGEEGIEVAIEPADENAENPADAAEQSAEDDFYRDALNETKKKFKPGGAEAKLTDLIIDGWRDRQDISELMNITPHHYDVLIKRVGRAAQAVKEELLRRKTP